MLQDKNLKANLGFSVLLESSRFTNTEINGISERSYLGVYFELSTLEDPFPNFQGKKPTKHRV